MEMLAYVLVSLKKPREDEVLEKLRNLEGAKEVHLLFGEWDFVVKIESESSDALSTLVLEKIRPIPEVEMTSTLIVAR